MTVISISITESSLQIISGIPKSISVSTNLPSTVFYTLDGSEPDMTSLILINTLELPTNASQVIVKLFATDGVNSSAVITKTYTTDILATRIAHDTVSGLTPSLPAQQDPYPFGTLNENTPVEFGNVGGQIVDAPGIVGHPDGYGADGTTVVREEDETLDKYELIFSTTDRHGLSGKNIGTLPSKIEVQVPAADPSSSNTNQKLFNPRALVIFQDNTQPSENDDILQLNRGYFTLDTPQMMDGGLVQTTTYTEGGNVPYGSFLRQHFNPKDNTITYYYRDAISNRWIISKENYVHKSTNVENLANVVFSTKIGSSKVFQWVPLMRSNTQFV